MAKNPGGRPSEYYPEICKEIIEFFDRPYTRTELDGITPGEYGGEVFKTKGNEFPTLEGFCGKTGIAKSTLRKWAEDNPEFHSAFEAAKEMQRAMLFSNALTGHYNASFAKFMAVNLSDYRDRQEVDHKSSDKSMSPVFNIVEKKPS